MSSVGIEGEIVIELERQRHGVGKVALTSTRPVGASRIFIGKTPQQVLQTIPALFSVCALAQSRAALLCIGQALSLQTEAPLERARDLLVLAENAKEHLLRIQLDWPALFERSIDAAQLPWLSRLTGEFKQAMFVNGEAFMLDSQLRTTPDSVVELIDRLEAYLEQQIFGCPLQQWLQIDDIDALREWSENIGSIAAQSLHSICEHGWTTQGLSDCEQLNTLDNEQLRQHLDQPQAAAFIAAPQWRGQCLETTALARQHQHPLVHLLLREFEPGLITRWVARLVELAQIPAQMRRLLTAHDGDASPVVISSKQGVAQIEAARGRLIHRVEISDGLISQYQIVAPTEWNFHPQGLLTQSLARLHARDDDELEKLAHLMINVIDPCVGYQLRLV